MLFTDRAPATRAIAIDSAATPLEALRRWPVDLPLFVLHSGGADPRWSRWSILAAPRAFFRWAAGGAAMLCHSGGALLNSAGAGLDPLRDLDALLASRDPAPLDRWSGPADLPFRGGWIGYFSYDLGRVIEPAAECAGGAAVDRRWPLIELGHCPDALIYDHIDRRWFAVGNPPIAPLRTAPGEPLPPRRRLLPGLKSFRSSMSPEAYMTAARRAIDYVAAGDAFQVNLARRLTLGWSGPLRDLAVRSLDRSAARYGAFLELPEGRSLISMSPELFLDFDPTSRRLVTRPIKGTRPSSAPPRELRDSAKDAAELHMIVDLMRNDLGRVAEFGSVRVACGRTVELHRTVQHGVAEIAATVRPGFSAADLLRATFPPGSVTGAPKIRAMQVIDELEPVRRGPYCGAVGFISDCGRMSLNVAIRTLALSGRREPGGDGFQGTLDYGTGGGIVADSDPAAEYAETETKAAVLETV